MQWQLIFFSVGCCGVFVYNLFVIQICFFVGVGAFVLLVWEFWLLPFSWWFYPHWWSSSSLHWFLFFLIHLTISFFHLWLSMISVVPQTFSFIPVLWFVEDIWFSARVLYSGDLILVTLLLVVLFLPYLFACFLRFLALGWTVNQLFFWSCLWSCGPLFPFLLVSPQWAAGCYVLSHCISLTLFPYMLL